MTDAIWAWVNRGLDLLPRPLDPVRSIKVKLGILLVSSGAAGLAVFWIGIGWIPPWTSATAIIVALTTSQVLAHGMTSPLREMTAAARAMARGDYTRRVRATSRDEVGELAVAFNQMSAELAEADRRRRELIANVSHELRTPITALQGCWRTSWTGSPSRSRPPCGPPSRRPNGSVTWSPTCSTCPGWMPAWCRCAGSTSTSRTSWTKRSGRPRSARAAPGGWSSSGYANRPHR